MGKNHEPFRNNALRWGVWALLPLMLGGCGEQGPDLVPVKGRLLDNQGKPVFPGSIWFVVDGTTSSPTPAGLDASGMLQEDGSFSIRTYPHGEEAMVGRYRVTLSLGAGSSPKLAKYAGPRTSILVVDVPKEGVTDLVIRLDADSRAESGRGGRSKSKSKR